MTAENKVDKMMRGAKKIDYEAFISLVVNAYETHYGEKLAVTYKEDRIDHLKSLWALEDIYNEKVYHGATIREAYESLYYEILEEVFWDELQAEREQEEADYRKNIDICIARERY